MMDAATTIQPKASTVPRTRRHMRRAAAVTDAVIVARRGGYGRDCSTLGERSGGEDPLDQPVE